MEKEKWELADTSITGEDVLAVGGSHSPMKLYPADEIYKWLEMEKEKAKERWVRKKALEEWVEVEGAVWTEKEKEREKEKEYWRKVFVEGNWKMGREEEMVNRGSLLQLSHILAVEEEEEKKREEQEKEEKKLRKNLKEKVMQMKEMLRKTRDLMKRYEDANRCWWHAMRLAFVWKDPHSCIPEFVTFWVWEAKIKWWEKKEKLFIQVREAMVKKKKILYMLDKLFIEVNSSEDMMVDDPGKNLTLKVKEWVVEEEGKENTSVDRWWIPMIKELLEMEQELTVEQPFDIVHCCWSASMNLHKLAKQQSFMSPKAVEEWLKNIANKCYFENERLNRELYQEKLKEMVDENLREMKKIKGQRSQEFKKPCLEMVDDDEQEKGKEKQLDLKYEDFLKKLQPKQIVVMEEDKKFHEYEDLEKLQQQEKEDMEFDENRRRYERENGWQDNDLCSSFKFKLSPNPKWTPEMKDRADEFARHLKESEGFHVDGEKRPFPLAGFYRIYPYYDWDTKQIPEQKAIVRHCCAVAVTRHNQRTGDHLIFDKLVSANMLTDGFPIYFITLNAYLGDNKQPSRAYRTRVLYIRYHGVTNITQAIINIHCFWPASQPASSKPAPL